MRKILYFLTVVALFSTDALAVTTYTYDSDGRVIKEDYGNGSYNEYSYYKDGGIKSEKYVYGGNEADEYTYNEQGKMLTSKWSYDDDFEYSEYTYDNRGNVVRINSSDSYSSESSWSEYQYSYDQYGNKTSESYLTSGGYSNSTEYSYTYAPNGTVLEQYVDGTLRHTYNEQGNLTGDYLLISSGDNLLDYRYEYDDQGRLTAKYSLMYYSWNPDLVGEYLQAAYEYDDNGNIISKYSGSSGTTWFWTGGYKSNFNGTIYVYDENGRVIEAYSRNIVRQDGVDQSDERTLKNTYEYDQYGNLISKKDGEGNVLESHEYSYEYDEYGNLVAIRNSDGSLVQVRNYNDPMWKIRKGKKIYTVEEATLLSKETGNKFRIRYK